MAAQEASHLSQLAKHVASMGSVTTSFKAAAGEHNKSIGKVIKDIGNIFANNKTNFNDLTSSINSLNTQSQQTASKIENTNNILQQSIQLQTNMLSTLKDIKKAVEDSDKEKKDGSSGGLIGSLKGWATNLVASTIGKSPIAKALGIGVAGYAGYKAIRGGGEILSEPGQNIQGGDAQRVQQLRGSRNNAGGEMFSQNAPRLMNDLMKDHNLNKEQAAAIAGWWGGESNLDPTINEKKPLVAGSRGGFGMAQWTGARRRQLEAFAQKNNMPVGSYEAQMAFFKHEVSTNPQFARIMENVRKSRNTDEAVRAFQVFQTGGDPRAIVALERRKQYAARSLDIYDKQNPQGAPQQGAQQNQGGQTQNQSNAAPDATPQQQPGATPNTTLQQGQQQDATQQQAGATAGRGQVLEDQMREAAVRKLPISERLKGVLQKAADEAGGVTVRVKSGGQPPAGGGRRTGSTRHDDGNAADLDLYMGDRRLVATNREDQAIFKKFVAAASAAGATGIGAGEDYMDPTGSRIHVGFGKSAIWGRDKTNATAAGWLREATGGTPGGPGGGTQYAGGTPGGSGNAMGGPSGATGQGEVQQLSAGDMALMQRFHPGAAAAYMTGNAYASPMMGGPMMSGMGMMPGMGMNPFAMLGGMIGGGRGAAIGGLAGMLLGGLSSAGSLMGPSRERSDMMQQTAVRQNALEDRSRQAAIRAAEDGNTVQNQQQAGQQRNQNTTTGTDYNGSNDMRVSDNSFFGDLMRSGMFSEQTKNLQFTA
jgi:hypothetical protein